MFCVFRGISAYCFSLETRHQFKSKFFSSDFNIKEEAHLKDAYQLRSFSWGKSVLLLTDQLRQAKVQLQNFSKTIELCVL